MGPKKAKFAHSANNHGPVPAYRAMGGGRGGIGKLTLLYSQTTPSMRKLISVKSGVADRNPLFVCGNQTLITWL